MKKGSPGPAESPEPDWDCPTPAYLPRQEARRPPCQSGCPNCGDIRNWIGLVAQRAKIGISRQEAYTQAWRTITDVNPFPSVLGRICPHPCEDHCNRGEFDQPLAINAMERFLGDWAVEQGLPLGRIAEKPCNESIGVVGAGPSGLSFAYQMARRGYRVTAYERREKAGGMLRYGVPDYRLPPRTLDAEIDRILELGVELRLNTSIGEDLSLAELRSRHTALYLGLGAQQGRKLGIPGEEGGGVWTGTDFLSRINCGETIELGRNVVVIGGGNTAIDAARVARRCGAGVVILYRRSREEMPAIYSEVEDAVEEGVRIDLLAAPLRLERSDDGKPNMLIAMRMRLEEPDASGRRSPVPVPDSEFGVPVDTLIMAVSQSPVLNGFEGLEHAGSWLVADEQGMVGDEILAGGDALRLGIAGNAIAQGRSAAEALHARLRSQPGGGQAPGERPPIGPESINFGFKPVSEAARAARLSGEERVARGQHEVAETITEAQFLREVERCFSCGSCMGCEHCSMFCTSACYTRLEEAGPGMYYALALDACKECGKCIEVCPSGFLHAT